jgi:drug/metabolite transporter (DMT)-like permease
MRGVRHVPAQHVLVVASLEPLAGTALAGVILKETLTLHTLAGALLITAGAIAVSKTNLPQGGAAQVDMAQSQPLQAATIAP